MPEQSFAILSPVLGIKQNFPSIALQDAFLPDATDDMKNFIFRYGEIQRAKLRIKEFSQLLPDRVNYYYEYKQKDSDKFLLLFSKRDIAKRNSADNRLDYLTPQYSTGVIRVENGSKEIYGGLNVDDCDDDGVAWVDGSGGDVTPARETTEKKENTAAVKLTVVAGAGVELLAYHDIAAVNLSAYDSMGFWFRSNVALDAGDLKFYMDDTAGCGSPIETIDIPAIAADTWTWVNIAMADPSLCTAIASLGVYQAVDKGAMILYIDQIVAGDWAGQLNANDLITIGTTYSTADTWYEVDTVTDTHITLTANYAGTTAYQQAYLARQTYTGGHTDYWEAVTFNDKVIAANGVNATQVWDGTNQFADLTGSPPIGKHLLVFENYVTISNLVVSGNPEPGTYAWCALGTETDWTGGDSGSAEIDDIYPITACRKFQGFWIMFTERSIDRLHFIGGDLVFSRKRFTEAAGCWAPKSVVVTDKGIYFYSFDHSFRLFTGQSWPRVSDPIIKLMQGVHSDYEAYIQGIYNEEYNHILWSYADATSSGNNNKVLVYDLQITGTVNRWSILDIAVCAFGAYEVETSYTWDTLPFSTWDTWGWEKWDTKEGFAPAPHLLGSDYSGYTFRLFGDQLDDGAAYTGEFVLATDLTPNKQAIGIYKRINLITMIFRNEGSGTMTLSVKKDHETSWRQVSSAISLDGSNDFLFIDVEADLLARNFLFKISGANKFRFIGMIFRDFEIEGFR